MTTPGPLYPQPPRDDLPPPHPRPIRGGRVAIGVSAAIAGHLVSIGAGLGLGMLAAAGSDQLATSIGVILIGQFIVFAACIAVGIVLLVRGDRGIGLGLLIGWGVGVVVLPVVGFGVCVALLSAPGGVG